MKNTNLIFGKTNSGKTKGILFNEVTKLMEDDRNIFILDKRGEYYKTFADKMKDNNYNTYVINLSNPINSSGYNPLLLGYKYYKDNNIDFAIDLIKGLALSLFKNDNEYGDPYWLNMASDYTAGLILMLYKEAKEEEINMGSLGAMLAKINKRIDNTNLMKKYLDKIDVMNPIYSLLSGTEYAPVETRDSILSVVKQGLNSCYIKENLLNMLSSDELDLSNINKKTAIFVIGSGNIANILIEQLYFQVKYSNLKIDFILDNIDSYRKINDFKDMIDDATYNDIKIYVATKDKEALLRRYFGVQFENELQPDSNVILEEGTYSEFPKMVSTKLSYFDLERMA